MEPTTAAQPKDIPNEPKPAPAMDPMRRNDTNLAPQGAVDLADEVADGHFTPEGDGEQVPNIPPSATDPA